MTPEESEKVAKTGLPLALGGMIISVAVELDALALVFAVLAIVLAMLLD